MGKKVVKGLANQRESHKLAEERMGKKVVKGFANQREKLRREREKERNERKRRKGRDVVVLAVEAKVGMKSLMMKKKEKKKLGEVEPKLCHQCTKNGEGKMIKCTYCKKKSYCLQCVAQWYPNMSEKEFAMACPFCRLNCNCKACLRNLLPIDKQIYVSENEKVQHAAYILQAVLPIVRQINNEQLREKMLEAKLQGLPLYEVKLKDAGFEWDDRIYCEKCETPAFDFYRSCPDCSYDLCLICCQELREGHVLGGKKEANIQKDGKISCPGCGHGNLELKHIMPLDWISKLLEKGESLLQKHVISDMLKRSAPSCMCAKFDCGTNGSNEKLRKAASRENSDDNSLFYQCATAIAPRDLQHFQWHWSKGEPIIVGNVLRTTFGLSWEPLVMLRAFNQKIANAKLAPVSEVDVTDCLDWCQVVMKIDDFLKGYLEGRCDSNGCPETLKLEECPALNLSVERLPRHYSEFISCLPFKEYTDPCGAYFNVVGKLTHESLEPYMGPNTCIAYGFPEEQGHRDSVTKLHCYRSDTVNILMHMASVTLTPEQLLKIQKSKQKYTAQDQREPFIKKQNALQEQQYGADLTKGGALWDIFRRQDVPKLEEYLRKHFQEFRHKHCRPLEKVHHPIHDQTIYLTMEHKRRLKEEFGIEPWTLVQNLGDAIFIPAGCPNQVKNLKSCINVSMDFISPESISECICLQREFRILPQDHRINLNERLELEKMTLYALDKAVADLAGIDKFNKHIPDLPPPDVLEELLCIYEHDMDLQDNECERDMDLEDNKCEESTGKSNEDPPEAITNLDNECEHDMDLGDNECEESTGKSNEDLPEAISNLARKLKYGPTSSDGAASGVWHGLSVGDEAAQLLHIVECCYPNTFKGVSIRSEEIRLAYFKEFFRVITDFVGTSVPTLTMERVDELQTELTDLERFGFELTWAQRRLTMVQELKFGKLTELEQKLVHAKAEYIRAKEARGAKLAEKFGDDYARLSTNHLGLGLLPRRSPAQDKQGGSVAGVWHGHIVGEAEALLLQVVESHYPNTFKGVSLRSEAVFSAYLKELCHVIIRFYDAHVPTLTKEEISELQAALADLESLGFDLSWAVTRLKAVKELKFSSSLPGELAELDQALLRAKKVYDEAIKEREAKAAELADKFGPDYDCVLQGCLGLDLLAEPR